jgi:hypothetical protein
VEKGERLGQLKNLLFIGAMKTRTLHDVPAQTIIKTPVGHCKSCRGIRDLQLCYLPDSALLFKILEKSAVKQG